MKPLSGFSRNQLSKGNAARCSVCVSSTQGQAIAVEDDWARFAKQACPEGRVTSIVARLESVLLHRWDGAKVDVFGSAATGLSLGEISDVDVCIQLNGKQYGGKGKSSRQPKKQVYEVADALRRSRMYGNIEVIAHAKVPLVRCVDLRAHVSVDLVPDNMNGVQNSRFIAALVAASPPFRELALIVKAWAKQRGLSSAMANGLSSYGHVCSVIHWCVAREPPLLPDLLNPTALENAERVMVGGLDMTFASVAARAVDGPAAAMAMASSEPAGAAACLLGGTPASGWPPLPVAAHEYFKYMLATSEGKQAAYTLSLRQQVDESTTGGTNLPVEGGAGAESGGAMRASGRCYCFPKGDWAPTDEQASRRLNARLSLEDPFETVRSKNPHDLGRTLSEPMAKKLTNEWRRAVQLLEEAGRVAGQGALAQLLREHGKCAECKTSTDGETDPSDGLFYCDACWRGYHGPKWQPKACC